mgnify:CR=1 FL=1
MNITTLKELIEKINKLGEIRNIETLQTIAEGQNNKVVYMPYEATGILSSVDGIKEMFKGNVK